MLTPRFVLWGTIIVISIKFMSATIPRYKVLRHMLTAGTNIAYSVTSEGFSLACKELTKLTLVVCFQTLLLFVA